MRRHRSNILWSSEHPSSHDSQTRKSALEDLLCALASEHSLKGLHGIGSTTRFQIGISAKVEDSGVRAGVDHCVVEQINGLGRIVVIKLQLGANHRSPNELDERVVRTLLCETGCQV